MKIIMIVEDDYHLRVGLTFDLEAEGYQVISAGDVQDALLKLEKLEIDLIVLDVNLPDGNGYDLCAVIKQRRDIPVIFLTANDLVKDQVKGFELGAEDYITKPFSMTLFRKRIEAVLRRCSKQTVKKGYEDGFLSIDFEHLTAMKGNEIINFTPTEFKLLKVLTSNVGNVLTRQLLLEKLWDNEGNFVDEHALTVNINRLRNKIEDSNHKYIKTVYGIGYLFAPTGPVG